MIQKKIFLLIIVIATVSVLVHHGSLLSWTMDAFYFGCPSIRSNLILAQKPKHTNVAFLKTHKTASSTMQNLFFRFAERHNLTVALPIQSCGHQFCYPYSFNTHFVHPHTIPPNIIASHMRFSKKELQHLMPNDTIYITILREPSSMFDSAFNYYLNYCHTFRRVPNHSLEAFLADPWRYYRPDEKDSMIARNNLVFDLGKDKDQPATDAEFIQDLLAEVEQTFSLVMIADYFDESLVVLRHLLSWDLDDILYFKLNMRKEASKRTLTPVLASKIRAWNSLDTYLYDYFNASLWRQILALGPGCVAKEVRELRQAQERLMRSCFNGQVQLRSSTQIKDKNLRPWQPRGTVDIMGYDLPLNISHGLSSQAQELCLKLVIPELRYTRLLLHSQSMHYHQRHQLRGTQQSSTVNKVVSLHPEAKHTQRVSVSDVFRVSKKKSMKLEPSMKALILAIEPKDRVLVEEEDEEDEDKDEWLTVH
ncbi:galactose-3-O-sulfotransferase 3 [Brachionichthys hirsutus]|uniref:galactose-3-O-sulfotransferase 3 n=1 Tax=Brachionichthys hirsutus TaxID=412623 RepID=UPI0036050532